MLQVGTPNSCRWPPVGGNQPGSEVRSPASKCGPRVARGHHARGRDGGWHPAPIHPTPRARRWHPARPTSPRSSESKAQRYLPMAVGRTGSGRGSRGRVHGRQASHHAFWAGVLAVGAEARPELMEGTPSHPFPVGVSAGLGPSQRARACTSLVGLSISSARERQEARVSAPPAPVVARFVFHGQPP